jgi:molecular chaperone HtpG
MAEMSFDWDGLINLLAKHLYSEKRIFIREIIQNAHDSIVRRQYQQPGFGGRINILIDIAQSTITFKDDGMGMNKDDLVDFLSTVGKGETRSKRKDIDGLIGQFGIGFLSAFVVADKVEVRTRKLGEQQGWVWINTGSRQYEIAPCAVEEPGACVTVFVNRAEIGILHEREISDVVRRYTDMLLVPIHINDSPIAINTGRMPWEMKYGDPEALTLSCLVYLESHIRDSVLEVIPFNLEGQIRAQGALYISSTRVFALDAPRSVALYLSRMFVCQNVPEILPQWASFVNGVINSPDLQPTAARDNIVRDEAFDCLRDELGGIIIRHLEHLRDSNPERFSEILKYHAMRIRAACIAYEEFLSKFASLIEWNVNRHYRV